MFADDFLQRCPATVAFLTTSRSYWVLVSFPPPVIWRRQPPLPFGSHATIFFLMTSLRLLCSGRFSSALCPLVTLLCHLCLLGGHKDMVLGSSSLGVSSSCLSPYVIRYATAAALLCSLFLASHASASCRACPAVLARIRRLAYGGRTVFSGSSSYFPAGINIYGGVSVYGVMWRVMLFHTLLCADGLIFVVFSVVWCFSGSSLEDFSYLLPSVYTLVCNHTVTGGGF